MGVVAGAGRRDGGGGDRVGMMSWRWVVMGSMAAVVGGWVGRGLWWW